jgi:hypothetical protein
MVSSKVFSANVADHYASTLLEQIGHERSWTSQQMDSDIAILVHNRLYFVSEHTGLVDDIQKY